MECQPQQNCRTVQEHLAAVDVPPGQGEGDCSVRSGGAYEAGNVVYDI